MTCPACNSIWLRPAEPAWSEEGSLSWARRFECGGCGAILVVRVTRIGTAPTDSEKLRARHSPPPVPSLAENGGTIK